MPQVDTPLPSKKVENEDPKNKVISRKWEHNKYLLLNIWQACGYVLAAEFYIVSARSLSFAGRLVNKK